MSTLITIDLDALAANYRSFLERLAPAGCAAVVKADAYGLGIARIASTLHGAGCRRFFTATHREGIALRALLPETDVYVFEGVTAQTARAFTEHSLTPVLITPVQCRTWAEHARGEGKPLPAGLTVGEMSLT